MREWSIFLCCLVIFCALPASSASDDAREHAERGRAALARGEPKTAEAELRQAVQLAPQEFEYLALLGIALGSEQKLQESDVYFEKALRLDPSDASVRRNLAWNQFQLGQLAPAKSNLAQVLKLKPGDNQATLVLGMVEEELKDYRTAVRLLEAVPDLVRRRPESIAALARSHYYLGNIAKARETLRDLQHAPLGAEGIFLGGQVAAEMHDFETASSLFSAVRQTYPDTAKLGYNLALSEYRSGQFVQGERTLESVIAAGHESSDLYNLLAWCRYKQDNFKSAATALDKAIALDPADETNYLDGGMMLLEHHLYGAALDAAEKVLEVAPDSYRGHRLKALVELRMGRVNDAESLYRRALELNPSDPQAITGLATAQLDKGNAHAAEETLKSAITRFPREALLYQGYGSMLLWGDASNSNAAEAHAVQLLRKAISLDGSLAESHYQLGKLALREDRLREAQQELEAAVKLDPASAKNHYALAQAYRKLHRSSDAAREVDEFQKLKSRDERTFGTMSAAQSAADSPAADKPAPK
ncbi:MAG TPA: tetratricopeptide repeat protein [Bryobacteraceae bacterium]|nr:tetratricopeptide repeat protein [Bryobacteraceae bacterium]